MEGLGIQEDILSVVQRKAQTSDNSVDLLSTQTVSYACFTWDFDLKGTKLISPPFGPPEWSWQLIVYPQGVSDSKGKYLGVFIKPLQSQLESFDDWSRPVSSFSISLLNDNQVVATQTSEQDFTGFSAACPGWGFHDFIPLPLEQDYITLQVEVTGVLDYPSAIMTLEGEVAPESTIFGHAECSWYVTADEQGLSLIAYPNTLENYYEWERHVSSVSVTVNGYQKSFGPFIFTFEQPFVTWTDFELSGSLQIKIIMDPLQFSYSTREGKLKAAFLDTLCRYSELETKAQELSQNKNNDLSLVLAGVKARLWDLRLKLDEDTVFESLPVDHPELVEAKQKIADLEYQMCEMRACYQEKVEQLPEDGESPELDEWSRSQKAIEVVPSEIASASDILFELKTRPISSDVEKASVVAELSVLEGSLDVCWASLLEAIEFLKTQESSDWIYTAETELSNLETVRQQVIQMKQGIISPPLSKEQLDDINAKLDSLVHSITKVDWNPELWPTAQKTFQPKSYPLLFMALSLVTFFAIYSTLFIICPTRSTGICTLFLLPAYKSLAHGWHNTAENFVMQVLPFAAGNVYQVGKLSKGSTRSLFYWLHSTFQKAVESDDSSNPTFHSNHQIYDDKRTENNQEPSLSSVEIARSTYQPKIIQESIPEIIVDPFTKSDEVEHLGERVAVDVERPIASDVGQEPITHQPVQMEPKVEQATVKVVIPPHEHVQERIEPITHQVQVTNQQTETVNKETELTFTTHEPVQVTNQQTETLDKETVDAVTFNNHEAVQVTNEPDEEPIIKESEQFEAITHHVQVTNEPIKVQEPLPEPVIPQQVVPAKVESITEQVSVKETILKDEAFTSHEPPLPVTLETFVSDKKPQQIESLITTSQPVTTRPSNEAMLEEMITPPSNDVTLEEEPSVEQASVEIATEPPQPDIDTVISEPSPSPQEPAEEYKFQDKVEIVAEHDSVISLQKVESFENSIEVPSEVPLKDQPVKEIKKGISENENVPEREAKEEQAENGNVPQKEIKEEQKQDAIDLPAHSISSSLFQTESDNPQTHTDTFRDEI